jgi:hypothetical protein
MPSITGSNLQALIDENITTYAEKAFINKMLHTILSLIVQWIDSGGTTGPLVSPTLTIVTSANFITARDCPIVALNGQNIAVFWIDPSKPLVKGTDWTDYPGGGFTMSNPAFDASAGTFTFWVFITT